MKVYSIHTREIFDAELATDHPSTIPGTLAIKRTDTGAFIALRDIIGVLNVPYQLVEVSATEKAKLQEVGLTITENTSNLHN